MTIEEYNKIYHPKIMHAITFVNCLEHAMEKTGAYEECMRQLECIGWSDEVKETIKFALEHYKDACISIAKYDSNVLSKQ